MTTNKTATRHLGHCQVCEGEFKLHNGQMVHHGYKRPGWGSIVGDCMGVFELPYEKSCDICKQYKASVEGQIERSKATLLKLEAGEITELLFDSYRGLKVVKKAECKSDYEWKDALNRKMGEIKYSIRQMEAEVIRMTKRIEAWVLTETKSFEEKLEEVRVAKAERAAIVAAKRAERAAKEQAKAEKKAALEARRAAETAAMFDKARELAAQDKPSQKDVEKLHKAIRKATWLWNRDYAPVQAELIKLGIMNPEGWLRP